MKDEFISNIDFVIRDLTIDDDSKAPMGEKTFEFEC